MPRVPAGVNVQGYVALIGAGKYAEALGADPPRAARSPAFAAASARTRARPRAAGAQADGAVSVMALKRFVADWEREQGAEQGSTS